MSSKLKVYYRNIPTIHIQILNPYQKEEQIKKKHSQKQHSSQSSWKERKFYIYPGHLLWN